MLRVTIANIDASFTGIFDTDDKQQAAEQALADLVANQKFFEDNRVVHEFPSFFTPSKHVYGMLMLADQAGDEDEVTYAIDAEDTYWIYVRPVEFGRMIDY